MSFHALVIDKPANGKMLRGILLTVGATDVTLTENSEDALALLRAEHYDVVLCDESAQPLNPVAFARNLRRDQTTKHAEIPLILIASAATTRHVELARDSGANDFIVRPVSAGVLKRKIASAILNPGGFVRSEDFKGPDRRRRLVPPDSDLGERRQNAQPVKSES